MAICARVQTSLEPIQSLSEGDLQKGSSPRHSDFDQGSGSDPEAGARGGTSLPNSDRELVAYVRVRTTSGSVKNWGTELDKTVPDRFFSPECSGLFLARAQIAGPQRTVLAALLDVGVESRTWAWVHRNGIDTLMVVPRPGVLSTSNSPFS